MSEKFDVVVVGSGASGAVCCDVFTSEGLRVCCVERGDWVNVQDVPSNHLSWELYKNRKYSFNPNKRSSLSDYPVDVSESVMDVANYNGVGGATILYSGHYPRFHETDFKTFSLDGVGADWPVSYEDLRPHYIANEIFLGVSGWAGDPMYPDLMTHLCRPLPLGSAGKCLAEACNQLGWHWWPSYSAILSDSKGDRSACTLEGLCNAGCFNGAKGSADVTFIRKAMLQGLDLRVGTTVSGLIIEKGIARGIRCVDRSGVSSVIRAEKIILAANAIGTCRLLWDRDQANFIGNSSGLIGKHFMMHPLGYVEGILPGTHDACFGPQGAWLASHEFYESDHARDFKRGYSLHFLKGFGPAEIFRQQSMLDREFLGNDGLLSSVKNTMRNKVSVGVICEDFPEDGNSVEMTDALASDGMPIPKIKYRVSRNTKIMMAHGMSRAKELLRTAGASKIVGTGPIRFAGWHLTGTTRMGFDRDSSVVNLDGEMHDITNLFIVDGGVFPTSSGVNPAATIQAVARYLAFRIIRHD